MARKSIANPSLKEGECSTVHCFERAGLGVAPFYFTGQMTEKVFVVPGCSPKPGSSCDYCGACIRYEFWVGSADQKTFKVGCDCIYKTGDRGLIKQISVAERKMKDMKNAAAKERKNQRIAARIESAKQKLNNVRGSLSDKPHPNTYFAEQGKTLLDYVTWCFENRCGEKAAFIIEREVG